MEIWFQINEGWYQRPVSEGFRQQLEPFQKDVEVFRNGAWRRAALCSIYSATPPSSEQIAAHSACMFNVEGHGSSHVSWGHVCQNVRPYTPPALGLEFLIDKEFWDVAIDADPCDWVRRSVYADWLEECGCDWLASAQRWQVANQKTPAPACVEEAAWHEASWFVASREGTEWYMPNGCAVILPEWCLPQAVFAKLKSHILQRRDGGSHNSYAKSWGGRREAEIHLAVALAEHGWPTDEEMS